ncbi:histidine phosphotransferase family protein [Paracoccus sp. p4-l81]|uniref:histidine phosphotransferase family protein n=1 Tax=unclassified Paracoccus (in: a-proteobacteria) TaxID=2688777 RepID=UPI0035B9AA88
MLHDAPDHIRVPRECEPSTHSPCLEISQLLAGLVTARLCHDLISPLGAIGNGVELLAMPGAQANGPELTLVSESVDTAQARIRMFRVAFGASASDQRMSSPEAAGLMQDLARTGRLTIDWQAEGDMARREVKMLLLAGLCLETALPRGGRVLVCRSGDYTQPGWRLVAEAPRTRPDPELWALIGPDEGAPAITPQSLSSLSPAQVQFALLPAEAVLANRRLHWELDEAGAEIRF